MAGEFGDDEFAFLSLDEDFVRGGQRELSADERVRRLTRELQAADELCARRTQRRKAKRPHRRVGRWMKAQRNIGIFVVIVTLVCGVAWFDSKRAGRDSLVGSDVNTPLTIAYDNRPTPKAAASKVPLGVVPAVDGTGNHLFEELQTGSASPVAYDPCRPVPVVINDQGGPAQGDAIIRDAIADVSRLTGLQFIVEGTTDEPAIVDRPSFQKDRYGDRWAPLLIGWSDPDRVSGLKDNVAGLGGSSVLETPDGTKVYVSGRIILDGPQLSEFFGSPNGEDEVRATVLHELGHVVGLDHVSDETQLMNPVGSFDVTDFASGDRAGLAELGHGACVPKL